MDEPTWRRDNTEFYRLLTPEQFTRQLEDRFTVEETSDRYSVALRSDTA